MRIVAICSAGGSAFFALADILMASGRYKPENFLVITDRQCEAEKESSKRSIIFYRVEDLCNQSFCENTQKKLAVFNPTLILLYFARLITEIIYLKWLTLNIHPSLLPSFKGFKAIEQAKSSKCKFFGATLHLVNEVADSGLIISQVVFPVQEDLNINQLQKISFIQKVYLGLSAIELTENSLIELKPSLADLAVSRLRRTTWTSNPALQTSEYINEFINFQTKQGLEVIIP